MDAAMFDFVIEFKSLGADSCGISWGENDKLTGAGIVRNPL